MYSVDERFFDKIGFDKSDVIAWGFKSYDDDSEVWSVSIDDAREFCVALGCDPLTAEI